MPSKKPARRLEDIVENIQAIMGYTSGMGLAAFVEDRRTYDAVERCLERISEAAAKLGDEVTASMADQPWPKIRALGNRLRHEYDAIREERLWDIIEVDLPPLLAACRATLSRIQVGDAQKNG